MCCQPWASNATGASSTKITGSSNRRDILNRCIFTSPETCTSNGTLREDQATSQFSKQAGAWGPLDSSPSPIDPPAPQVLRRAVESQPVWQVNFSRQLFGLELDV